MIELRHSGHDWLGHVPNHWTTRPLWSLYRRVKDVEHPEEEMLSVFREHGVVVKDNYDNLNKTAENRNIYQLVHPGWLVVNRMKAWQGSVGISDLRGIVSGHYICFSPTHSEDCRYLNWLLRSDVYRHAYLRLSRGVRIGQAEIDNDSLRELPVLVPPSAEQREIATFLDHETAQIDALIDAERGLVDRLEERRSAVSAAVLDSILSDVKLGRLLKHHIRGVRQGWSPQCHPYPRSDDSEWAVLRTGCVNGGRFSPEDNKALPDDLAPRPDTVVRKGEIVMSRANTRELLGSAAVVASNHQRLMLSDKLYALDVLPHANPWFIAGLLGTRRLRDLIEIAATGASQSMQNISQYDIVNLPVELPPRDVQDEAVERLALARRRVDNLVSAATDAIALLQERRVALISAAVTGRLDPRTGREFTPEMVLESA